MTTDRIMALRAQIGGPRDGALLRYSLGLALLESGDGQGAATSLRDALGFDPAYSAAWKALGRVLLDAGDRTGAADTWRRGIDVAEANGDVQAGKEMRVFLRRIDRDGTR